MWWYIVVISQIRYQRPLIVPYLKQILFFKWCSEPMRTFRTVWISGHQLGGILETDVGAHSRRLLEHLLRQNVVAGKRAEMTVTWRTGGGREWEREVGIAVARDLGKFSWDQCSFFDFRVTWGDKSELSCLIKT